MLVITINDYQEFLDFQLTLHNTMKQYISLLEDMEKQAFQYQDINQLFELLIQVQKISLILKRIERTMKVLDQIFNQKAVLN